MPVLGSGHPLADIMLLKHSPQTAEIHEGVAFFGRSGQAVLKSIQRLHVDPMAIYGTNCVKFEGAADEDPTAGWRASCTWSAQDRRGHGARCAGMPERRQVPAGDGGGGQPGEIQRFTPTIDALLTPDVDASLDEQKKKRAFWEAFKALGPWWSELPPY